MTGRLVPESYDDDADSKGIQSVAGASDVASMSARAGADLLEPDDYFEDGDYEDEGMPGARTRSRGGIDDGGEGTSGNNKEALYEAYNQLHVLAQVRTRESKT